MENNNITSSEEWLAANPMVDCEMFRSKITKKQCKYNESQAAVGVYSYLQCYPCSQSSLPDEIPPPGICVVCGNKCSKPARHCSNHTKLKRLNKKPVNKSYSYARRKR